MVLVLSKNTLQGSPCDMCLFLHQEFCNASAIRADLGQAQRSEVGEVRDERILIIPIVAVSTSRTLWIIIDDHALTDFFDVRCSHNLLFL